MDKFVSSEDAQNKVYLKHKASKKKDINEILYELIPHTNIFADIEKNKFKNGFEAEHTNFISVQLHKDNLYQIYSNGLWSGFNLKVPVHSQRYEDEWVGEYRDFEFNKELVITIDDLYVYDVNLLDEPKAHKSQVDDYEKLYPLIGILLDLLIDRDKTKNVGELNRLENILKREEYLFDSQGELNKLIKDKYEVRGYSLTNLETIFGKANATIRDLIK